jgi:type II secretory pathway pseudopilin PulG
MVLFFNKNTAFSLLELIIVFAIVITISGIIFPVKNVLEIFNKNHVLQSVLFDINEARLHARVAANSVRIVFSDKKYSILIGEKMLKEKYLKLSLKKDITLSFNSRGMVVVPKTIGFVDRNNKERKIIVSKLGRVRVE